MKRFLELLILFTCVLPTPAAEKSREIKEFLLDEHTVYAILISTNRVTTISFPGPISAIDGAQLTIDGKVPGAFQIAHVKGSYFFSVRALTNKVVTNVNIRWKNRTFVLELIESDEPLYSVVFRHDPEPAVVPQRVAVTPSCLLTLLDKAKSYPLLKQYHPDSLTQVEYRSFAQKTNLIDYKNYEVQLDEVFRFNPEDTLIFRVLLRNKTDNILQYRPDGFSLRVGERTYPQSISDASGTVPPRSEAPAYFAVTGTPNGGRNELSLKNDFTVILEAAPVEPPQNSTP